MIFTTGILYKEKCSDVFVVYLIIVYTVSAITLRLVSILIMLCEKIFLKAVSKLSHKS